jgi:transcriptional regulator with XRE-family HTH domain
LCVLRPEVQQQLEAIAANVRRRRARLGLTQEQFSEQAGFNLRFLQSVERGRVNITIETLVRLAVALHVGPAQLLRASRLPPPRPGRPPASGRGSALRRPLLGRSSRGR